MKSVDELLSKLVRFLWVFVAYLGLNAIVIAAQINPHDPSFPWAIYLFIVGALNLVNAYGLFKKTKWAFRTTFFTAVLNLIFFILNPLLIGVVINILLMYMSVRFRDRFGAHKDDTLLPKKWLRRKAK